jgi:hypothetical protein
VIALVVTLAQAADRELCIQVDHEFTDTVYTTQRYDLDDFLNDDAVSEPLRGVLIWVSGPGYFQVAYADDQTGCQTFTGLTVGVTYTVRVWSEALVEGHTIELLDDDDTPSLYTYSWSNWTVWGAPVITTRTIVGGAREWNVMTAATFAIHRRDGGLPPQTFTLYNEICPTSSGSCYSSTNDSVYTDSNSKFVVVHELGHYLAHRKIGSGGNSSLGADTADCHGVWDNDPLTPDPIHEMQSKEHQSGAFWEGFAHFYGAVVFNRITEADCFVQYYKPEDYDLDLDQDPNTVNCAGVPWQDAAGNLMDTTDSPTIPPWTPTTTSTT